MSGGGRTRYSNKIANYMLEHELNLVVGIACGSACAEDILPAAQNLHFFDEPIISFHGNSQSALNHLSQESHEDPCQFRTQRELIDGYKDSVAKKLHAMNGRVTI